MIKDSIINLKIYENMSSNIKSAINYVVEEFLPFLEDRNAIYEGQGFKVFKQIYMTNAENEGNSEAHRKYIDIQIIVQGKEKVRYLNKNKVAESYEYQDDNDVYFNKVDCESDCFVLNSGEFVLFTTEDVHMPSLDYKGKEEITKVVVKIENDLIENYEA
jgi:YhcH/YjgK/YiaL family protein